MMTIITQEAATKKLMKITRERKLIAVTQKTIHTETVTLNITTVQII